MCPNNQMLFHQMHDCSKRMLSAHGRAVAHVSSDMWTHWLLMHRPCTRSSEPESTYGWLRRHWELKDTGGRSVFYQNTASHICPCPSRQPYTHVHMDNAGWLSGFKGVHEVQVWCGDGVIGGTKGVEWDGVDPNTWYQCIKSSKTELERFIRCPHWHMQQLQETGMDSKSQTCKGNTIHLSL